jgi:hypothetical protein
MVFEVLVSLIIGFVSKKKTPNFFNNNGIYYYNPCSNKFLIKKIDCIIKQQ